MDSAAYRLLKLVESYAAHPGDTVCKFLDAPVFGGNAGVAFDAQQLLEGISCTGANDVELLRDILLQVNQVHEELVGPVSRVNFIAYVSLHTYYALAHAATSSGDNEDKSICIFIDTGTSETEVIDTECCSKLMLEFLEILRTKGHVVNPRWVLAERASELTNDDVKVISNDFDVSSSALCNYLSQTFCHDAVSKGYEAGRLAVDCFLLIQSVLSASFTTFHEKAAVHALVKQMIHIVRDDDNVVGCLPGGKGCVFPGVSFLSLMRICKEVDALPGSCVLSPLDAFERLCNDKGHYVDLILLFSRCEKTVNTEAFQRFAASVESIHKGVVVIVIRGHVELTVLHDMLSLGNARRTVLIATGVDEASMAKLSLAFRIMPRALGSLRMDTTCGVLRLKSLFSHDSYRSRPRMDLRRVLLVLNPLRKEVEFMKGTPEVFVSVLLGGRCHADCTFLERAFSHQLHHLVNVMCLPSPLNVVVPACGASEAYFLSYLDEMLRHQKPMSKEGFLKTRLLMALRDATVAYLEIVLKKSFGLTVDEASERISVSRQRFGEMMWDVENKECHCAKLFPRCVETGSVLYNNVIPAPPLLMSSNQSGRSNVLLADITEWEAQVEVASAFLSIGRCLDTLCFSSILGKRVDSNGGEELFFYSDIV